MPGSVNGVPDAWQGTSAAAPLAPIATDWLCSTLQVDGRAAAVARFREAASGPGIVPWRYALEQLEEDWYHSLAAPADGARAISLQGARILARRLRDATLAIQQRQLARMLLDRSCPFDLHRLLPVPDQVLRLGPDDPVSQAWLWAHWGTTRALRRVRELPASLDGAPAPGRSAQGGAVVGGLVAVAGAGPAAAGLAGAAIRAAAGVRRRG